MPLSSAQLAALVDRARQKPPPVVSPPPPASPRLRQATPTPPSHRERLNAPSTVRPPPAALSQGGTTNRGPLLSETDKQHGTRGVGSKRNSPLPQRSQADLGLKRRAAVPSPSMLAAPAVSLPAPSTSLPPDERPWFLDKSSWHFHRRFYAVFRRPMAHGEYSSLLKQVRSGNAEHLGENYWRVTLRDGRTTLSVVATRWRLVTILPKNRQPLDPQAVVP